MNSYILITPVKDEEKNIQNLIYSVKEQTIRPVLWVIVDDGSKDNTSMIIKNAMKNEKCIAYVRLKEGCRDIGLHISVVYKAGFDFAIDYCKKNNIEYDYVGVVDGDMILEDTFFEKLINKFDENQKIGIASGGVYYKQKSRLILETTRVDLPRGSCRLIRKECFEDIGGYLITYAPDTVANAKAKLRGWGVVQFKEIKAVQSRKTSSAGGLWKGYMIRGEETYFLYCRPIHAILKCVRYLVSPPFYVGLPYFMGYITGFLCKRKRTDDEEIKRYFQSRSIKKFLMKQDLAEAAKN